MFILHSNVKLYGGSDAEKKKKKKITVMFYEADSAGQMCFLFVTFV